MKLEEQALDKLGEYEYQRKTDANLTKLTRETYRAMEMAYDFGDRKYFAKRLRDVAKTRKGILIDRYAKMPLRTLRGVGIRKEMKTIDKLVRNCDLIEKAYRD